MDPQYTGLSVEICIDDREGVVERNHPLWLFFQNGYGKTIDFLPVSVEDEPKMMLEDVKLNIARADFESIRDFIKQNKRILQDLATGAIDNWDIVKRIVPVCTSKSLICHENLPDVDK